MTSQDTPGASSSGPDRDPEGQSPQASGQGWTGPGGGFDGWSDGLTQAQVALQQDLSCLVDGELDEAAAARAMVRLEESPECREFLDDIRRFGRMHRDLSDPQRLEARIAMLGTAEIARAAEDDDLAHRLATILYQLGKAYTLASIDSQGFRERVFAAAVPVSETKTHGRGFVDGVMESGRLVEDEERSADDEGGTTWAGGRADWLQARHLLNGRLEKIVDPMEKGRRLLGQATEIDPSHEEARIYLAFIYGRMGKTLRAAALYRDVFDTAMSHENRGHAAMQLGRLHFAEGDVREALVLWRWITISGLAASDIRFSVVQFNIGIAYAKLAQDQRALTAFRALLDAQLAAGDDGSDVAAMFVQNDGPREILEARPGFLAQLMEQLPELFHGSTSGDDLSTNPS